MPELGGGCPLWLGPSPPENPGASRGEGMCWALEATELGTKTHTPLCFWAIPFAYDVLPTNSAHWNSTHPSRLSSKTTSSKNLLSIPSAPQSEEVPLLLLPLIPRLNPAMSLFTTFFLVHLAVNTQTHTHTHTHTHQTVNFLRVEALIHLYSLI